MTSNLNRRIAEHNLSGSKGAKYTRVRKPVFLAYFETFQDIKSAMHREAEIKKWSKAKKEILVKGNVGLIKK